MATKRPAKRKLEVPAAPPDYYAVLGVERTNDLTVIDAAWERARKDLRPNVDDTTQIDDAYRQIKAEIHWVARQSQQSEGQESEPGTNLDTESEPRSPPTVVANPEGQQAAEPDFDAKGEPRLGAAVVANPEGGQSAEPEQAVEQVPEPEPEPVPAASPEPAAEEVARSYMEELEQQVDAPPPRTAAELRRRIKEREAPIVSSRYERLLIDRDHGVDWIDLKLDLAQSNLTAEEYCREHLGMGYGRLKQCARLAANWAEVRTAHFWLLDVGQEKGWVCTAEAGYAYGFEVMTMMKRALEGEAPDTREKAAAEKAKEKALAKLAAKKAPKPQPDPVPKLKELVGEQAVDLADLRAVASREGKMAKVAQSTAALKARHLGRMRQIAHRLHDENKALKARLATLEATPNAQES